MIDLLFLGLNISLSSATRTEKSVTIKYCDHSNYHLQKTLEANHAMNLSRWNLCIETRSTKWVYTASQSYTSTTQLCEVSQNLCNTAMHNITFGVKKMCGNITVLPVWHSVFGIVLYLVGSELKNGKRWWQQNFCQLKTRLKMYFKYSIKTAVK